MIDCSFPLIEYAAHDNQEKWGQSHGEEFKTAIAELYQIRLELLLKRNPHIKEKLTSYARMQWEYTKKCLPLLSLEFAGIAAGSGLSIAQLVLLNNYTDFRDLSLEDEGCSTVAFKNKKNGVIAGQTWDMHQSAKNYLCCIKIPATKDHPSQLILSLVGCVGLCGINNFNLFIGVNNLNTTKAQNAMIWPMLVRACLSAKNYTNMRAILHRYKVTSAHSYLLAHNRGAALYESHPSAIKQQSQINKDHSVIFHTNHCLHRDIKTFEDKKFISKTTIERLNILNAKKKTFIDFDSLTNLLRSHEGRPMSICTHYNPNNVADPSQTCGAIVVNFKEKKVLLWRGCKTYDQNYSEKNFTWNDHGFSS